MSNIGEMILYKDATGFERSLANVDADRTIGIDAETIIDIWDPMTCPLRLLPFLAWAMGVTFWNQNWSETTQRQWLAQQWTFKSLRGTYAGVAMAIDFAGRDVTPFGYSLIDAVTQPNKIYSGPALTVAQREAWLAKLPQVRVYYYRNTPIADAHKAFVGGWTGLNRRFFTAGMFMTPSVAPSHLERRATYNVDGVDTDINVTDFGSNFQLHIKSQEGLKVFENRPLNSRFFQPSDAWKRLINVRPDPLAPWRVMVGPSENTVSAQPELVTIPGQVGYGVFSGSGLHHWGGNIMRFGHFFLPSTAKFRMFDRFAINDGSTYSKARPNVQFMGVGRYGWPAFTARLDIKMPGKRSQFAAGAGVTGYPNRKFWIPHDPAPMHYVTTAVEASRRLIDKFLLAPKQALKFTAGRPFIVGTDTFIVGRPSS